MDGTEATFTPDFEDNWHKKNGDLNIKGPCGLIMKYSKDVLGNKVF